MNNFQNITITGDGNVLGSNNNVVTSINKGLSSGSLRELGEAFALLRGEIIQSEKIAEKDKKQATNAIEDVEGEVADKNPNPNRIAKRLQDFKEIMEASGQVYDSASGWGKRLSQAVGILKKVVPVVASFLI